MRELKHILQALCLLFSGCVGDTGGPRPADGGGRLVTFTIQAPAPEHSRGVSSRAMDENGITNAYVAVLEQAVAGGDYEYSYFVRGSVPMADGDDPSKSTFQAQILTSGGPVKLVVLANYPDSKVTVGNLPAIGSSEADLRAAITMAFTGTETNIPMSGDVTLNSYSSTDPNEVNVTLTRAFARVDIHKVISPDSYPFVLQEAYVYRANDLIQVLPTLDAAGASVPAASTAATVVTGAVTGEVVGSIYIPESMTTDVSNDATCIIVGGLFDEDDYPTYYRIDFDSGEEGHPFGQVLRNYVYDFTITKVFSRGAAQPGEAATSAAGSMIATVEQWEEQYNTLYFGNDAHIFLSSRALTLGGTVGSQTTLTMETQNVESFTFGFENSNVEADGIDGDLIMNNYCHVQVSNAAGSNVYIFTVTAFKAGPSTDNIVITAAGMEIPVSITQGSPSDVSTTKIRVMSVGTDIGSLGNSFTVNQSNGNAANLRALLTNGSNFGPTGKVTISGFTFDYIPGSNVDDDNEASYLAFRLLNTDILVVPYNTDPSPACAAAIAAWLARPGHVMFMYKDDTNTNVDLNTALGNGLVWFNSGSSLAQFVIGATEVAGFTLAGSTVTEANRPFFAGPFGAPVRPASMIGIAEGIYQVAWDTNLLSSDIVPLMNVTLKVAGLQVQSNFMFMCVDPVRRIVYMGDSQINSNIYSISGGSSIGNYMNTLLCNIWAWAVGEVLQ